MKRWIEALVRVASRPLEATGTARDRYDAIIVLGAPLRPDGTLGRVPEERVRAALELWQGGVAPLICLTGGRTRGNAVAEAHSMAEWLRARGVPDAALIVEAASQSTFENAREMAKLLIPKGNVRVLLVTQPFHLRRAAMWFRRFGFEPGGHRMAASAQFADPLSGLRWVLREYGAWAVESIRRDRRF